jgi:hypothetical protein
MDSINNEDNRKWQRDINEYVRSDKPTNEKIDYLVELIADIEITELKLGNTTVFKPTKEFLRILLRELKDKQNFELIETPPSQKRKSENIDNPHQQIFPNSKCWQLFEYWKDNAKDIKSELCFAYWQMIEDKLMYKITPTQYASWLVEKLQFDFEGYWKQSYRVKTKNRERLYSLIRIQFELNKSQY